MPGIKVDAGAKPLALHDGELVTEGLDGLRERLAEYSGMGARFAKWRAVITIDDTKDAPSRGCYEANAHALARYAALCQEAGIVPIVEPEVLMDGAHTLARCAEVTERALYFVFDALRTQRVLLEGMILKPNMVVPGLKCATQDSVDDVADATVRVFRRARAGGGRRHRVPVGRAVGARRFRAPQRDAPAPRQRAALAAGVLVRARDPGSGDEGLGRQEGERGRGAEGAGRPRAPEPAGAQGQYTVAMETPH